MNIETGELRGFGSNEDFARFINGLDQQEREKWISIDPSQITNNQKKAGRVSEHDQRSSLAVIRNIIRRQKRSARRRAKKEATK